MIRFLVSPVLLATYCFGTTIAWPAHIHAQDATQTDSAKSMAKARMAEMTSMIGNVRIEVEVDGKMHIAKREPQALLRMIELGRKGSGKQDGSLWLWSHNGLPVAIVELWAENDSHNWGHTMLAVSHWKLKGLAGPQPWKPKRESGVQFQGVLKADKPHERAFGRKVQMRSIARRFKTNIEDPGQNDKQQYRLLTEPIHRYKGDHVQDGAIFAFVRGASNAEVLLFVQAQDDAWEYGLLRCSSNELRAQLDKVEVWVADQVPGWIGTADGPFWVFHRRFSEIGVN